MSTNIFLLLSAPRFMKEAWTASGRKLSMVERSEPQGNLDRFRARRTKPHELRGALKKEENVIYREPGVDLVFTCSFFETDPHASIRTIARALWARCASWGSQSQVGAASFLSAAHEPGKKDAVTRNARINQVHASGSVDSRSFPFKCVLQSVARLHRRRGKSQSNLVGAAIFITASRGGRVVGAAIFRSASRAWEKTRSHRDSHAPLAQARAAFCKGR